MKTNVIAVITDKHDWTTDMDLYFQIGQAYPKAKMAWFDGFNEDWDKFEYINVLYTGATPSADTALKLALADADRHDPRMALDRADKKKR